MATVRLSRDFCTDGDMPDCCARCDRPAVTDINKEFSWHPSWIYFLFFIGVLPLLIVMLCVIKRMWVNIPFCQDHRYHWRNMYLFGWLTFLGGIALMGLTTIILVYFEIEDVTVISVTFMIEGAAIFLCLLATAIWSATRIRPAEITDDSIELEGVSQEFARQARILNRHFERDYYEDEEDTPPRKSRDRDDY